MSGGASRRELVRTSSPRQLAVLAWRKAAHRKTLMRIYGATVAEHVAPAEPSDLAITVEGPEAFELALGVSPHLSEGDLEHFRAQTSWVILVRDADEVVACSWMTQGEVWVPELVRRVHVPHEEHLSCRTWVPPEYRGRALMSHMLHAYAVRLPADHVIWGFALPRNAASIRSIERIGWRHRGDAWTRWVLGRRIGGERRFPPRPPEMLDPAAS